MFLISLSLNVDQTEFQDHLESEHELVWLHGGKQSRRFLERVWERRSFSVMSMTSRTAPHPDSYVGRFWSVESDVPRRKAGPSTSRSEVHGAGRRPSAAAVAQVLGGVSKAVVVSVEQRVGAGPTPVFGPVGIGAAGAVRQVQRAAHFSWTEAALVWLGIPRRRGRGGLVCSDVRFGFSI